MGILCQHNGLKSDWYSLLQQPAPIKVLCTVLDGSIHSNRTFRMHCNA